jgi:hypothetical protein
MPSVLAEPSCPTGRCSPFTSARPRWARRCRSSPASPLQLHAEADVNPDLDELERLELVVHGKVVAATTGPGRVEVEHRLIPAAGCWIAARAVGANNRRCTLGSGVRKGRRRTAHVARAIRSCHRRPHGSAASRPHRKHAGSAGRRLRTVGCRSQLLPSMVRTTARAQETGWRGNQPLRAHPRHGIDRRLGALALKVDDAGRGVVT